MIKMKAALFAATMIAGLAVAGAANATVAFSFTTVPATANGVSAGYTVVQDFSAATPTGLSGSGYVLHAASPNDTSGAAPVGSSGKYLAVLANGLATYTLAAAANSIQFDWGTASGDNLLTVFTTAGNFTYTVPNSAAPDGANYQSNGLLTATASGTSLITGLSFGSGLNSFEIDNIAVSGAVPEPASWAMMVLGFGLIGAAARSRRTAVTFA